MELEDMKTLWVQMNTQVETQKILTDKLIVDLTEERYHNRFNKLQLFESIGAAICFGSAIFLGFNLGKLDTWYLMVFGIITLVLLIVLPIIILRKISNIKRLNLADSSYKEVLVRFQKHKKALLLTQKMNVYLSLIIAFTILPVTSKILKDKNLFEAEHMTSLWIYTGVLLLFLVLLSRWGLKGYRNVTKSAERILMELER